MKHFRTRVTDTEALSRAERRQNDPSRALAQATLSNPECACVRASLRDELVLAATRSQLAEPTNSTSAQP
eukprot:1510248-Pleurochrysis_carterae.AAC.1